MFLQRYIAIGFGAPAKQLHMNVWCELQPNRVFPLLVDVTTADWTALDLSSNGA